MTFEIPDGLGLDGKVAIVAGAGAVADGIGNGRAAAILLAKAGTRVVAVDRDEALGADLTQPADCKRVAEAAVDTYGRLDFLDNNIGISSKGSVVTESQETWQRMMQVNVEAMFLMAKHAIPMMTKTAGGGAIVNISSISALRPRGLTIYTTTKAAVIGLTKAMAVDHGKEGIRVNAIAPGPVYTPMVYARGNGMSEQARDNRRKASALQREGTGWDIGLAVRFLLSDHARYITGQTLVVDGGVTLLAPDRESHSEQSSMS